MKGGASALRQAILDVAPIYPAHACTAFDIAARVEMQCPGRWDEGTIRTGVSRVAAEGRLARRHSEGRSPRGQKCDTFRLVESTVQVVGGVL